MGYYRQPHVTIGPNLTPKVKILILTCVGVFFLQNLAGAEMYYIFGLVPYQVVTKFFLWQPVSYLFLHGGFLHLLFNMFALWMFGSELERNLGGKRFLQFYFVTGVGAGILSVLVGPFSQSPIVGASGSIYGILMAYGMLFPERYVYLYFLFPVKVKYFVAVLGAMAFLSALGSSAGSPVAHFAHLGGMIFAFFYLKGWLSVSAVRDAYRRWRMNRLRAKFKVYERKQRERREDDFWIN